MKRILLLQIISGLLLSCDTVAIRPNINTCISHRWIKGTFQVINVENNKIFLKNIEDGSIRTIFDVERGWKSTSCSIENSKNTDPK